MKRVATLSLFLILLLGSGCRADGSETAVIPATPTAITPLAQAPQSTAVNQNEPELPRALETQTVVPQPNTPTPISTSTHQPTVSPQPIYIRTHLGNSVLGQPIEHVQLGHGPNPFVIMGALHGGHECNTGELVEAIVSRFIATPALLPPDVTLHAIPVINPDGCTAVTRTNTNQVDLNRNWDTPNWVTNAEGPAGIQAGSGGQSPFSEPETALIRDWLNALSKQYPEQSIKVISYHSVVPNSGLVQPGYSEPGQPNPSAIAMASTYATATGYLYSNVWIGNYIITGEFINWATDQGFVAIDVELPDKNEPDTIPVGWSETHAETNFQAVLAIMAERP